ncbi:prepilin-type N-terminal cleavage/methylation domain-containing protein [Methyloferula stellata]|uniref:prepilin-type N-terminal cleavage/methylation domain-containing protein n=1 Tax=Methyloferula stellata TaxID=876270 RepID=UPI00036E7773|nr:prepilin-type N-terminal cleavage/methylation domain-containing protein [Methyloferula stellata]
MANSGTSRAGFTLVETLAALAIGSVIIFSTGALIHQSVFFFDRGTRTVDQSEQLALAIDSLTRDFGAARFVLQSDANGLMAAFTATSAGKDAGAKIIFVTSGGKAAEPQGEEIVSLAIEEGEGFTQLVRRRAPWRGPRMHLEDAQPDDPVILLRGKFDISFSFSELADGGELIWRDDWTGETGLPHSVRLNLQDRTSRAAGLVGAEFPIHANAPTACAIGEIDCLSVAARNVNARTNSAPSQPRQ